MKQVFLSMSPSGTTSQVVKTIAECVSKQGEPVYDYVIGNTHSLSKIVRNISAISSPFFLWVGSPVYVDHALPAILETLRRVELSSKAYAAAFVTYGGVTSGLALEEVLDLLQEKQFVTLGGMKVLCQHSSFRTSHSPMAGGHPKKEDLEMVRRFVEAIMNKMAADSKPLEKAVYAYQTEKMRAMAHELNLEKIKKQGVLPAAQKTLCTHCGWCVSKCPVQAISLAPDPVRTDECIRCLNCIHLCPQQAFPFNAEAHETMIRGMAEKSDEPPCSAFFV